MESVGVRELRQRASEIVRLVRERGEEVEITYRGEPVARLVPLRQQISEQEKRRASEEAWARLDELAQEISAAWPEGVSAVEAIREQRREL